MCLDDFIPLPLEDADPIIDRAAAALGPCRPEHIADLLVTQQQQTAGEKLTARLANPRILEAAGQRPGEIANAWHAFRPSRRKTVQPSST